MATDDEVEKKEAEDSSEEDSEEEEASSDDGTDEESEPKADARADEEEEEDEDEEEEEEAPKKAEPKKAEPKKAVAKASKKADDDEDDAKDAKDEAAKEKSDESDIPSQLGHRRYVYAAYLAATIAAAFVLTKALDFGWFKLSAWKPEWFMTIGIEPRDEIIVPVGVALAVVLGIRYWRDLKVRTMAEEVAEELTKVTWPTRDEVTNSTTVVIITTIFATIFFALMDQFWLWVTKHVYGS